MSARVRPVKDRQQRPFEAASRNGRRAAGVEPKPLYSPAFFTGMAVLFLALFVQNACTHGTAPGLVSTGVLAALMGLPGIPGLVQQATRLVAIRPAHCRRVHGALPAETVQVSQLRTSTNASICRSFARTSYFRQPGYSSRPLAQISSRSRGVARRAVACQVSPPTATVACGWAFRLWYQAGCLVPPKLDAMRARPSGCGIPYTATVREAPDLAPVVVSMTTGMPVAISPKLLRPPVALATRRSRWCAVGRRSATPTVVDAKRRIVR